MENRETPVFFRRIAFGPDFSSVEPKWHVMKEEPDSKYGVYTAVCGYSRSNILGEIKVSRAKARKKVAETCQRCVAALGGKPITDEQMARPPRQRRAPKPQNPVWGLNEAGEVVQL